MNKINSIQELKELALKDGGLDCFIHLNGGLKSCKHITYSDDEFGIENFIDGSFQKLTEDHLNSKTNIIEAIEKGALYEG